MKLPSASVPTSKSQFPTQPPLYLFRLASSPVSALRQKRCSTPSSPMEARRLAVLHSHLCPSSAATSSSPPPSLSVCATLGSSDAGRSQNGCVFCQIVRGESPALKLYEDDKCLCILDSNPLCRGHSLIIPKSHFPSLDTTPPSVISSMCSIVPFISNAIMRASGSDSFNLLVNNGVSAGQVIYHTHIHIIPRQANDCLWNSESLPRYPLKLDQETFGLVDRVHKLLPNFCEYIKGQESSLP